MCPRCRSNEVSRSKSWRFRDILARAWGMKPFRCRQCQKRFYLPSRLEEGIEAEHAWLQSVRREKERQHQERRRSGTPKPR